MATFSTDTHIYARFHIWNLIIGVQYITAGSTMMGYSELLTALEEELGDQFKKPVVLVSVAEMGGRDFTRVQDLGVFDYEFGV